MKVYSYPREELIRWCRERAAVNRKFDGRLTPSMLNAINSVWPAYFEAVAALLERDRDQPGAGQ